MSSPQSFNPGYAAYTQAFGTAPAGVNFPIYVSAAPTSTYVQGPVGPLQVGQIAIWPNNGVFILEGYTSVGGLLAANWITLASGTGSVLSVAGTANQVTSANVAGAVTLSLPTALTAPGSVTATTNLATTNGNLTLGTAGNKLNIATGTNASVGVTSAMVAGAVTITSTAITAASVILYERKTLGGTAGLVAISAQAAGSATLTSASNTETSTFNYLIIN